MFFRIKLHCENGQIIICGFNGLNPYKSLIGDTWEEFDETNTKIAWTSKIVNITPQLLLS